MAKIREQKGNPAVVADLRQREVALALQIVLGFPTLRVPKASPNLSSRRISEKNGMRLVATEEREYVSGRFTAEIWEITAAEWNKPSWIKEHHS